MPSLLRLLAVGLLLSYQLGDSTRGSTSQSGWPVHPFYKLSMLYRGRLLRAWLDFIGCYNATFTVKMLFASSPSTCQATCGSVKTALFKRIREENIFGLTTNLCMATLQGLQGTIDAKVLRPPDENACQMHQCSCTVRFRKTGILLTRPEAERRGEVAEENPYGSNSSPVSCNASVFAPWLAIRLSRPAKNQANVLPVELPVAPEVTISDVVLDPVCSAFINRLPPEAASNDGALALLNKAQQEASAAMKKRRGDKKRAAETSTKYPDLAHKPKRTKKAHSCSRPSPGVQTLYQPMQMCPTPKVVDECKVPSPAANEVAPMAQDRPRPNQAIEERQLWNKLFGFTEGELDNLDKLDDVNAFVGFFDDDADS
jgi:hypothetical protein